MKEMNRVKELKELKSLITNYFILLCKLNSKEGGNRKANE